MKFERESWRKLYVAESLEHRIKSVFTRGIRDYLLRHADDDGTIIKKADDPIAALAKVLGVEQSERKLFKSCIDDLVELRYLSVDNGRLWITRFTEGQQARSPGAKRTATWKAKREAERQRGSVTPTVSGDAHGDAAGDVTGDATGDVTGDVTNRRDETRRDENPQSPPVVVTELTVRARRVLANTFEGNFEVPSEWPEVVRGAKALSPGMRELKLRNDIDKDADLRGVLSLFADGYTVEDLEKLGELSKSSEYFRRLRNPGPAAFTPAVCRRLLNDSGVPAGGSDAPKSSGWSADALGIVVDEAG
jgi:hypothetical protein